MPKEPVSHFHRPRFRLLGRGGILAHLFRTEMTSHTHILYQSERPPITLRITEAPTKSPRRYITIEVVVCDKIIDDDYLLFLEWAHPIMAAYRDGRTAVEFKGRGNHRLVDVLENLLGETEVK